MPHQAIKRSERAPSLRDYDASPFRKSYADGCGNVGVAAGMPLVSIVTVVFNAEKTLERAIQSVLEQTYSCIEYVIIDGASIDGSPGIIKKYENRIAFWVSEPDSGISDAFNKGIALTHGEIIGILNADDWYEKDAVAQAVGGFRDSGADVIYSAIRTWHNNTPAERISADHGLLDKEMSLSHPAVFVTRPAYEQIGLYRADFLLAMDYEWLLRAKKAGVKFHGIDRCLVNVSLSGISNMNGRGALREEFKAKTLHNPNIFNRPIYYYKVIKSSVRRFFESIGLGSLVKLFHEHISSVKKHKADGSS